MCIFALPAAAAAASTATAATATAATAAAATTAATAGAAAAGAAAGGTLLSNLALAASVVGAGVSAYGAYQTSKAGKAAADYNAELGNIKARDAVTRGENEQQRVGAQQASVRARQSANMAANGLDLSSGSPLSVLEQTDYYGLQDQYTVANNANREAWGYRASAAGDAAAARAANPAMAAGASLLGSAGQVADRWYRYSAGGVGSLRG